MKPVSEIEISGFASPPSGTEMGCSRKRRISARARSWKMCSRYSPGGTPAMVYWPVELVTAYHGVLTTAMIALMVEWILQKTRTMPGDLKVTLLDVRGGYRPTSNGCPLKFENALWKIR